MELISKQTIIDRLDYVIEHGVPNSRGLHQLSAEAVREMVEQLPPANNSEIPNSSDTISRAKAIEALAEAMRGLPVVCKDIAEEAIEQLPPAQPEQDREFIKLAVRNSNGRPLYSIIYLEFDDNGVGHDFEGYSSYSLDVISDYLKKYFMPPAQPERTPMQELLDVTADRDYWKAQCHSYEMTINRLTESAQPERIKGRWIKISPANIYECSECGKNVMTNDICVYDFCHGCGAEMEVTT